MARSGGIATSDGLGDDESRRDHEERRQHAGFSIFLDQVIGRRGESYWETRLYHNETGMETTLAGAFPEGWVTWVLERSGASQIVSATEHRRLTASAEVAGVEIVEAARTESTALRGSQQIITAKVVLRLAGVALEREIGSQILQAIAAYGSTSPSKPPGRT